MKTTTRLTYQVTIHPKTTAFYISRVWAKIGNTYDSTHIKHWQQLHGHEYFNFLTWLAVNIAVNKIDI